MYNSKFYKNVCLAALLTILGVLSGNVGMALYGAQQATTAIIEQGHERHDNLDTLLSPSASKE